MKANLDIMSVSSLVIELHAAQQRLTLALQAEYFCDDLDLPPEAYGWGEARIRSFYESGGEATLDLTDSVVPLSAPSPVAPPVTPAPAGRPAIVCFGDACVELASHSLTFESVKHDKSPPVAGELLVAEGLAAPILEQGPGWLSLLARDYAWRCTADVINRGFSGYTTRMALSDLPDLLASLPVSRSEDTLCVLLQFGGADLSASGDKHVPSTEFAANLSVIISVVKTALPAAHLVVMSPPVIVESRWQEHARARSTPPGTFSLQALKPYVIAAEQVAKAGGASFVDVHSGMLSRLMQFNDALGPTGRHLSQKGNNFVYRMLKEHLSDTLKIGPRALPMHRPPSHAAAYPDGLDNDAKLKKAKR